MSKLTMEQAYAMRDAFLGAPDQIRKLESKLKQCEVALEQAKSEFSANAQRIWDEARSLERRN